ncbi:Mo-co oxidoreductase dimerisation domain-containing protein [Thalassobacillus cyri]|uniref:Mo-co oxidoreductase dimerisation domain-containing protein n=1 Tax=Thalassobacillus cyri TaxID=571932 RepID=A0A1H3Z6F8_9BACI|nr:sulfite oxidase [Thalassobacillus cyri]SEA19276.1 Mo-co oxidoreductase dimerisation domain-containing protein [Thalassobacillus cyri]
MTQRNRPYLITRNLAPENQESPIHFLKPVVIPPRFLYRRNHFPYPEKELPSSELFINGLVNRPLRIPYHYLLQMDPVDLDVTLECAGNKRAHFEPKVFGEQWESGAISRGVWTGVPLRTLLDYAGVSQNAVEIVFTGTDHGKREDMDKEVFFQRSLPLKKALHPDIIIAFQYNGNPIPYKHGWPFRLIVPNWYAMASVKWLQTITVIDHNFQGPFQTTDYVYYPHKENDNGKRPVTTLHVNSTIQQPLDYTQLDTGTHTISGIAWTGEGTINEVSISLDEGKSWHTAKLKNKPSGKYSWKVWSYTWHVQETGEYTILAKAKDSKGRTQPLVPFWNRKGYGYNAVSTIHVKIV